MSTIVSKFCVSLLPKNEQELKAQLSKCRDADLIEIRLDWLERVDSTLMISFKNKRFIGAVRTKDEGGFFSGSLSGLINIYRQAIDAGVDYIDISHQNAAEVMGQPGLNFSTKIILSLHTQERDIDSLKRKLRMMSELKADMYKLVFPAENLSDNRTALNLIDFAKKLDIPFIIHAQAEKGKLSRILGSIRGNAWTYVSLGEARKTAPGQLTFQEATKQYYLREKNSNTYIFGLTGFPLKQSKGWLLFNRLFHLNRMNAIYLNFPAKNIEEFWRHWQSEIDGLSVTIPHKENILKFVSHKSKEVEASGVCNTLLKRGEFWEGYNTDFLAMVELLQSDRERFDHILVYGTGATARSAISALQRIEAQKIFLTGRNRQRGEYLADLFSITFLEDGQVLPDLSAIIQTTPVGMYPNIDDLPACAAFLKKDMLVFDVVHNPPVTRFLQSAKEKGCTIISGEEMYLHQAALQYTLFTEDRISVNYIKKIRNELF